MIIRLEKLIPDKIYCTGVKIYTDGKRIKHVYEILPCSDEIAQKIANTGVKRSRNKYGELLYYEFEGELMLTERENGTYTATITRVVGE